MVSVYEVLLACGVTVFLTAGLADMARECRAVWRPVSYRVLMTWRAAGTVLFAAAVARPSGWLPPGVVLDAIGVLALLAGWRPFRGLVRWP